MSTTTKETAAPYQTINSAAALTGLSRCYIRSGCISGTVPHVKSGCKYLVNVPKLLEMLDAQTEVSGE